jgi:hypothetical protein
VGDKKIMFGELYEILCPYKAIDFYSLKPEQKICVEFANQLRKLTYENNLPYIWFHIPNEFIPTKRLNYSFDLKQKHMGKISGTPDYALLSPKKSFFIEFKTKRGSQSPNQVIFESWCKEKEILYHLCTSSDEALSLL